MAKYFIAEARDQLGIASYLTMEEIHYNNGDIETVLMPVYEKEKAHHYKTPEETQAAINEWLIPGLSWTIIEETN